jgi:putative ABC transport system ATP-binding protein
MPPDVPAVQALGLRRTHRSGRILTSALTDATLTVRRGEVVAVVGPSGSGKSTLLLLLAGLDHPDAGTVHIAGVAWTALRGAQRAAFRRANCGFVVQGMGLLARATAAENVELPLVLDRVDREERSRRAAAALDRVGLAEHRDKLPDQLSGGQLQRVAIARALVVDPVVLLADEPTAKLDSATGQAVTDLLLDAARERDTAVVLVTHDPAVAARGDRCAELRSGRLDPS